MSDDRVAHLVRLAAKLGADHVERDERTHHFTLLAYVVTIFALVFIGLALLKFL